MIPVPINVVTDNGGSWTTLPTLAPANTTTYTDSGLSEGRSCEYRVCATNAAGDSAYADAAQVYTQPVAPTGLSAAFVSAGEIDLTWTINSTAAYGYAIEQSTDGGVTWTADPQLAYPSGVSLGQTFTYADAGPFTPSTPYAFRVRAYSYYGGYSAYTNVASVATPAFPAAPSDLTGYAISDSQINLNWTDNSSNEAGFIVQRSADNGQTWTSLSPTGPDVTSAIDSGLPDGMQFSYRDPKRPDEPVQALLRQASELYEKMTVKKIPQLLLPSAAVPGRINSVAELNSILGASDGPSAQSG